MTLTRHKYRSHPEFLALRQQIQGKGDPNTFRMGASEVGTTYVKDGKIGLDEWTSPTVFFYQSCDYYDKPDITNLPMLRGKIHEHVNYSEYWRYMDPADPSIDTFMHNRENGNVIRRARKSNEIIINHKYPWLFMSPDYIITRSKRSEKGPLEIKSLSSMENGKYKAGVAEKYVIQNHHQMLLGGWKYGELFDVENQTTPKLYQFEYDKEIAERIIENSHDFWLRVMKGKAIVHSGISQLEKDQMLAELAPPDDGNPLYTDYLKDKHNPELAKATVIGTEDQLQFVIEFLKAKEGLEEIKTSVLEKENKIREWFNGGIGEITWEGVGHITWFEKFNVPKKLLKMVEA